MTEPTNEPIAEPQTPEPEEEDWQPPAETVQAAAMVATFATQLAAKDSYEAGRLLRIAAGMIDPRPTPLQAFLEGVGDAAEKALPMLLPLFETALRNATAPTTPLGDCFPCGAAHGPVRQWPRAVRRPTDVAASLDDILGSIRAGAAIDPRGDRQASTGLSEAAYQRFKARLTAAYGADLALEITGHLYGIPDEPVGTPDLQPDPAL